MIVYGDACCVTHFLVGNLLASKRKRVSENIQKCRNNSMATQRYTPSKVLNKTERVKKKKSRTLSKHAFHSQRANSVYSTPFICNGSIGSS